MSLIALFKDSAAIDRIQKKLPVFFYHAELESQRAGKTGMEVGSLRERIIIALFVSYFGSDSVNYNIPITEPETDVYVENKPVSIKTITGKTFSGIKLCWTVDHMKAIEFKDTFVPKSDLVIAKIVWDNTGYLILIPIGTQERTLSILGRDTYFKLPKENTNPRGVELSKEAFSLMFNDEMTLKIPVMWTKPKEGFDPVKRWVDLWKEE